MAKGRISRKKKSVFQKGNAIRRKNNSPAKADTVVTPRKFVRLSEEHMNAVEHSPVGAPVDLTVPEAPVLLRPKKTASFDITRQVEKSSLSEADQSYRVLSHIKVLDLINEVQKAHSSSECQGDLCWDSDLEKKRGVCWIMGLKCCQCSYRTGPHKLYHEVQRFGRGRRAASANIGIQVGLTQSPISNTGMRQILMYAIENILARNRSMKHKLAQHRKRKHLFKQYDDNNTNDRDTDYKKAINMPRMKTSQKSDHSYSKLR